MLQQLQEHTSSEAAAAEAQLQDARSALSKLEGKNLKLKTKLERNLGELQETTQELSRVQQASAEQVGEKHQIEAKASVLTTELQAAKLEGQAAELRCHTLQEQNQELEVAKTAAAQQLSIHRDQLLLKEEQFKLKLQEVELALSLIHI
eukprot:TRINITY_DN50605_c0_g1_i2.p1 TRINITY_DN50605_c0_g1~~TRINITY_DN50605_c0_g1_i2.p1  ORF type:complete len:149 (+),score=65.38 TRINITY_DN50605_c0_g1_i2:380-826(+)